MERTTYEIVEWFFDKDYSIAGDEYIKDRNKQWIPYSKYLELKSQLKEKEKEITLIIESLCYPCKQRRKIYDKLKELKR